MTSLTARTAVTPARSLGSRLRHHGRRLAVLLGLPAVLAALWWIVSERAGNFFFPPLSEILAEFGPTWFDGRLGHDLLPSLGRLAAGYALALLLGVALGVLIGTRPALRAFAEPVLEFFRAIPPPVMVPILMLFLGIGTTMKVVVIVSGAVWPVLLNTVEGVRGIDGLLHDTARVYRLRPLTRLRTVVLRGASPGIVTGARQALSIAIVLMVISEMFAANNGLGFSIVQFQRGFALPEMWTGIILLGLVGLLLSLIFRAVERAVLAWYRGQRQAQRGGSR
ncbi:ABC transporter permease [Streptomyces hainanensis]|uniref:ABC transporter permease subunit n=1 Tax=Streptomyces hainanensis TaxID=402648 RepID=A0A4R4TRF4_9ACTN|nr:ABC transporter permease subunit [Streptomyces hainanensis]TDC77972.1 ABC transporter permease subunit [Streptomyces hainanensis]